MVLCTWWNKNESMIDWCMISQLSRCGEYFVYYVIILYEAMLFLCGDDYLTIVYDCWLWICGDNCLMKNV